MWIKIRSAKSDKSAESAEFFESAESVESTNPPSPPSPSHPPNPCPHLPNPHFKESLAIFCRYGLALPADKILKELELSILT